VWLTMRNTLACLAAHFLCLAAWAPRGPPAESSHVFWVPSPVDQEYRMQVGDERDITFFSKPELNEQVDSFSAEHHQETPLHRQEGG